MTYPYSLCGSRLYRRRITIPDNTSTGATIKSLLLAAGYAGPVRWFKISGVLISDKVTPRPAITLASVGPGATAFAEADYTTHGEAVPAGVEYISGPSDLAGETAVRSDSASTILATIVWCA